MTDMLSQIRSWGEQLRWASKVESPHIGTFSDVLYAGMGGSGIVGDFLSAIAGPLGTRVSVHKDYGPIPVWAVRQRPLVVAASYSGNTEETLDLVSSAYESGLPVATVTTGGRLGELSRRHSWPSVEVPSGVQPRAAAGYMLGAALKLFEGAYAIDDQRLAFVEAANLADEATAENSQRWVQARQISEKLSGRIPIIYGGGTVSRPVAQRWKTQINENVKIPAWWSSLPELDHNEVTGWETIPEITRENLAIVALTDWSDHDRIRVRLDHTRALTENAVPWVGEVESSGSSVLARLVSLTIVGDLTSWMMAETAGVDPVPVLTIENLKQLLAKD
jgi:glucose/mannose-6-phosphate isomerase